ncbi:MAG: XRE family transcriptional regulator [Candidatus Firestonebacteria bacterium]
MSVSEVPSPPKLGKNILRIRKEKKMSLDALAKKSGVLKAMLFQIELENTNPTLATLWKIAHGLNVPLEELLGREKELGKKFEITRSENLPVLFNDTKKCKFDIISTLDMKDLEIYVLRLKKGGSLNSTKHYPGTEEILHILNGSIEVRAGKKSAILNKGDVIRYNADVNHLIKNISNEDVTLFMVERFE